MRRIPTRVRRVAGTALRWARRHRPWHGRIPSCRIDHAAVSDGRTLTGQVSVTRVPPEADGFTLVFTKGDGTVRRYEIEAARLTTGRFRIAVPLEGPGSADLRAGTWRVGLAVAVGADVRTLPVRGRWHDDERGPTLWNPRSPVTGRRYRPGADNAGDFTLTARAYAPHAEVDRVGVEATSVDITGRLIGKGTRDATGAATVVLRQTATGEQRELPARITKRAFSFSVPADVSWSTEQRASWSATLQPAGGVPLAVQKRLSDLRDLAGMIRYPSAELPNGARLVPVYTGDGSLVMTITPPPPQQTPSGASESPA